MTIKKTKKFNISDLLGEDNISIEVKPDIKKLTKKTQSRQDFTDDVDESEEEESESSIVRKLKSKSLSLEEKVAIVEERISIVLRKQKDNVIVIDNINALHDYVSKAIASGRIDIDTETNNSLDPVTCKIMGTCLYYPGGKAAYIPHNHVDLKTGKRLAWQITEQQMGIELARIAAADIEKVMHNGKFDYEVIYCTTGIKVKPTWDTMVGWRLLDENDEAGLKHIYTVNIDPTQVKYDLDSLCGTVLYEYLNPYIFALYAATDAMMTDKVYLLEKPKFEAEDAKDLYDLFKNIEMPITTITGDMEMTGVAVDQELGQRLKDKYTTQLTNIDIKIEKQMKALDPAIKKWRLSKEANEQSRQYEPKKPSKKRTPAELEEMYPLFDKDLGKHYKLGKPKTEQLPDKINLAAPVQLAILFYDVLKCPAVSKKNPRGTGLDEMTALEGALREKAETESVAAALNENTTVIEGEVAVSEEQAEELNDAIAEASENNMIVIRDEAAEAGAELCSLILKRRNIMKLVTTYIDVIPVLAKHWPDGRIRFHLNSLGTDTGRYSSGGKMKYTENGEQVTVSGINIQNIPSHNKEIRMLFHAATTYNEHEVSDNTVVVPEYEEVETVNGWKYPRDLTVTDLLITDDGNKQIRSNIYNSENKTYCLTV